MYVWLREPQTAEEIEALYRRVYAGRPMVRIRRAGHLPELHHVAHTNFCDIGFALDPAGERLVVVSCLDNLGKGAAGQAVQNLNGMFGFEKAGRTDMRMVIKFAGALLERPEGAACNPWRARWRKLARQGHELLVVHGGGKIFTATLQRLGIKSRFVDGLRVTDRETRDVALMVLGGLLNKQLAAAISAAGQPAVGISAGDSACFRARPLARPAGLGFVGELTGVNASFFKSLWKAGMVPVAACLGLGPESEIYNINADQMAAAAAEYVRRRAADLPHRRGRRAGRQRGAGGGGVR